MCRDALFVVGVEANGWLGLLMITATRLLCDVFDHLEAVTKGLFLSDLSNSVSIDLLQVSYFY